MTPTASRRNRTIHRLKRQLAAMPEAEPFVPWITEPAPVVGSHGPNQSVPPPGGWPDDAGWREEAESRQSLSGEEPQC